MSVQLDRYLALRATGATMMTAAAQAGLSIEEARLTENSIARGELSLPAPPPAQQKEIIMGRKAASKADEIEEIKQPDFAKAARILRNDVSPLEEKGAKQRGDLSAAWKAIQDDCHVNKKAAKLVNWMRTSSGELKDDFLRSLYGLMGELKLGISQDLVDQMGNGEVPDMPVVPSNGVGTEGLAALN